MKEHQNQSPVRYECKCHIVWCPKYSRKKLYGQLRQRFGEINRFDYYSRGRSYQKTQTGTMQYNSNDQVNGLRMRNTSRRLAHEL